VKGIAKAVVEDIQMIRPFIRHVFVGAIAASLTVTAANAEVIHLATAQGAREAVVLPVRHMPAPTMIVLHGATVTAARTAEGSGFAEAAATRGFVSVFPQGVNRQWNDGREGRTSAVDDVGFLRQLVDELVRLHVADPSRIYIAGISNGGMMTFRMLCEASELFAGAVTIIANMPAGIGEGCTLRKPTPIIMFNGTADPLVPYDGGGVGFWGKRGIVWSTEQTVNFLLRANDCDPRVTPLPVVSSAEAVQVTRFEWSRCHAGHRVALYRFEGGGHQVPGRPQFLPGLLGLGSQQINAAERAFAFLAQ
jgi:polyhydroxybutyrate depolymerase